MSDVVIKSFFPDGTRILRWALPELWNSAFGPDVRCKMPYVEIHGTIIANPAIAVSALFGVFIGLYYGARSLYYFRLSGKYSEPSCFYGLSFLFFATMNISALFYHCFAPPPLYIEDIGTPIPYNATVTHIAHVIDICSTACSCLAFIIGRLYQIHYIRESPPVMFLALFAAIYYIGFVGLIETEKDAIFATRIPFIGELLYPGILTVTALCAPLLNWPKHKHASLLAAFCTISLAFGMGLCEVYLCEFAGPDFTAPLWAFLFCDVTFLIVADLVGLR